MEERRVEQQLVLILMCHSEGWRRQRTSACPSWLLYGSEGWRRPRTSNGLSSSCCVGAMEVEDEQVLILILFMLSWVVKEAELCLSLCSSCCCGCCCGWRKKWRILLSSCGCGSEGEGAGWLILILGGYCQQQAAACCLAEALSGGEEVLEQKEKRREECQSSTSSDNSKATPWVKVFKDMTFEHFYPQLQYLE